MRYWDDKDGNGKPLTDGRVCLVIKSDDTSMPEMRTYGLDKDEVLEKVAKTAETAQAEIHRLRNQKAGPSPAPAPRATADELARATADLSDPAKSPEALATLLRAAGVPVDKIKAEEAARRVAGIAKDWQTEHPDFPDDPRNCQLLINHAAMLVGFVNIDADALDRAFRLLEQQGLLYEPAQAPPVQPRGSEEPRTVRTATSYRSTSLRAPVPVVTTKPKYTTTQLEAMSTKEFGDKIKNEPGFADWYNKTFAAKTA